MRKTGKLANSSRLNVKANKGKKEIEEQVARDVKVNHKTFKKYIYLKQETSKRVYGIII